MIKKKATSTDPPEVVDLFQKIARLFPAANGFDDVIVRSVAIKYAKLNNFYSGVGAAKVGGRWNRRGLEAIYASLDVSTATEEAYQDFIYRGFSMMLLQPRVVAGAKATLSKVLDLTDTKISRALGFKRSDLVEEDWRKLQKAGVESWTQAIGRGCYTAKFEGIIAPSARRRGGANIVIFPKQLKNTSTILVLGADQLPP
jgi:RES domain-containing protein